jgi:hypothetical protein
MIQLRAKWSLFRQRILLTIRWRFRLPIDDIHDQTIAGLRRDVDALASALVTSNTIANTAAALTHELNERLKFYERHCDPLVPIFKRWLKVQEREIEAQRQANEAAKREPLPGELIDCRRCGGSGEIERSNRRAVCDRCEGSRVEPNPEFQPKQENTNAERRLKLE